MKPPDCPLNSGADTALSANEDATSPVEPLPLSSLQGPLQSYNLRPSWIQRLIGHRFFRLGLVVGAHLVIFFAVSGWIVYRVKSSDHHHEKATFQIVQILSAPPGPPAQKSAPKGSSAVIVKNDPTVPSIDLPPIMPPTPQVNFGFPVTLPPISNSVAGLQLLEPDQNKMRADLGDGLGNQMSQLLFQLPLIGDGGCALVDDHSLILHLKEEGAHTCTVLVRGIVEQATYVGGVTNGYVCAGGTPQTGVCNIYELDVDDPPQTYFLNAGVNSSDSGVYKVYSINYSFTLQIKNGARLTLHANSIDQREIVNDQSLVVPDTDRLHPLAVNQPYNGQFIQVDAIAVDEAVGGDLLAAALRGPHPAAPVTSVAADQTATTNKPASSTEVAGSASPMKSLPPYGKVKPVNVDLEQNGESNIWIYVGLNGGKPHRYLLDTGSWGFYALYSPKWWPGNPKSLFKTDGSDTEMYGDMTYGYSYVPVYSSVILYNYFNSVRAYEFPEKGYGIAKASTWYDDYDPAKGVIQPSESITDAIKSADENGDDLLDDHGFFGAGTCTQYKGTDALGYANLSNLLGQTPGDGYVITDNGPIGRATLTIGLNDAIRSQFSQFLAMRPNYDSGGFPNTHWPSFDCPIVQISLSRPGHKPIVFKGSFWIDSGSGDSNVRMPANASHEFDAYINADRSLKLGTVVRVTDPTRKDGLDYTTVIPFAGDAGHGFTGQVANKDTDEIGIWFGIDFFRRNSIMYDLKNGVMGFSPERPELDQSVLDAP